MVMKTEDKQTVTDADLAKGALLAGGGTFLDFAAQVDAELVRMGYTKPEDAQPVAVEKRKE